MAVWSADLASLVLGPFIGFLTSIYPKFLFYLRVVFQRRCAPRTRISTVDPGVWIVALAHAQVNLVSLIWLSGGLVCSSFGHCRLLFSDMMWLCLISPYVPVQPVNNRKEKIQKPPKKQEQWGEKREKLHWENKEWHMCAASSCVWMKGAKLKNSSHISMGSSVSSCMYNRCLRDRHERDKEYT
jgi:hypothetical protein